MADIPESLINGDGLSVIADIQVIGRLVPISAADCRTVYLMGA